MINKPRFESLPWALRQSAVTILGWRNKILRLGTEYEKWTSFISESSSWNEKERREWQKKQLLVLLDSAKSGSHHYEKHIPPMECIEKLDLEDILKSIPILEKATLRDDPDQFKNSNVRGTSETSTSGSTGSPMKVSHDRKSIERRFAFLNNHLNLAGVSIDSPSVRISGRLLSEVGKKQRKPWLYNPAEKQLFLSTYHLDHAHSAVIVARLKQLSPLLIDGYPSGVLETLRLLKKEGHQLKSLKAIITTAETLQPAVREELTELSGVPIMDYYAASEGVPIIQQCHFGTYHVRWQSGIFEIENGKNISLEGDGELICTSFVQDKTPLIRYRTGDLVKGLRQSKEPSCRCGLITPIVDNVLGRVEDMIQTSDGRTLGMFTYRTLKYIEGLKETQVIQHDFSVFEVNSIVAEGANISRIEKEMKGNFERALGYPIALKFNQVNRIPYGPSGKIRLVISKIPREETH